MVIIDKINKKDPNLLSTVVNRYQINTTTGKTSKRPSHNIIKVKQHFTPIITTPFFIRSFEKHFYKFFYTNVYNYLPRQTPPWEKHHHQPSHNIIKMKYYKKHNIMTKHNKTQKQRLYLFKEFLMLLGSPH